MSDTKCTHCWHEHFEDANGKVLDFSYMPSLMPSEKMKCCRCNEVRDRPACLAVFSQHIEQRFCLSPHRASP